MESKSNMEIVNIFINRNAWKKDECILWILWWAPFNFIGKTIRNLLIKKIQDNVHFGSQQIKDILDKHIEWDNCDGINCEIIGLDERDPIRKLMKKLNVTKWETDVTKKILCKFFAENECKNKFKCIYSHHPSLLWYDMTAHVEPWYDCRINSWFGSIIPPFLYYNLFLKSNMFREKYGVSIKVPRETDLKNTAIQLQYDSEKLLLDFLNYISNIFELKISIDNMVNIDNLNLDNKNLQLNLNQQNYNQNSKNNSNKNNEKYDNNNDRNKQDINLLDDLMIFSWETIGIDDDDPIKKRCKELNIEKREEIESKNKICSLIKSMKCSKGGKCKYSHHPSKLWEAEKGSELLDKTLIMFIIFYKLLKTI